METPVFVNADMFIGDVVMRYPVTAQVMMSYGLHCVGCHASGFETIRQGAMGHGGMDDEDVEILVDEMNQAIAQHEVATSDEALTVTKRAVEKIGEFGEREENTENMFLRVKVIPGGCSGFKYDLDFDRSPQDNDTVLETETFAIRIDPDSADFLKGSVLDYIDGLDGSGFKIENPNATEGCGCGKSFA